MCSLPRGRHLSIPTEKHGPRVQWPRIVRPPSELCRYTLLPRLLRYIEWTSYLLIFILNTRTRNSHGQLHCTGLQRQIESSWIVYNSIKQISCPRPYYALFFYNTVALEIITSRGPIHSPASLGRLAIPQGTIKTITKAHNCFVVFFFALRVTDFLSSLFTIKYIDRIQINCVCISFVQSMSGR